MIRRIILFLWLLLIAFFAYRRYDQPAADALLYKIRILSFNKSTYTTSVDGVILSTSGTRNSIDTIWSTLLSRNATIATLIAIGSKTTGSLVPINLTPIQEDQAIDEIIGRVIQKNQTWQQDIIQDIPPVPCPECDQARLSSSSTKKTTSSPQAISTTTTSTNSTSPTLSSQDQAEADNFLQALYQD